VPATTFSALLSAWPVVTSVEPLELLVLVRSPVVSRAGVRTVDALEAGSGLTVGAHVMVGTEARTAGRTQVLCAVPGEWSWLVLLLSVRELDPHHLTRLAGGSASGGGSARGGSGVEPLILGLPPTVGLIVLEVKMDELLAADELLGAPVLSLTITMVTLTSASVTVPLAIRVVKMEEVPLAVFILLMDLPAVNRLVELALGIELAVGVSIGLRELNTLVLGSELGLEVPLVTVGPVLSLLTGLEALVEPLDHLSAPSLLISVPLNHAGSASSVMDAVTRLSAVVLSPDGTPAGHALRAALVHEPTASDTVGSTIFHLTSEHSTMRTEVTLVLVLSCGPNTGVQGGLAVLTAELPELNLLMRALLVPLPQGAPAVLLVLVACIEPLLVP